MSMSEIQACPDCRGEGGHWIDGRYEPCDGCGGTGRKIEAPAVTSLQAHADTNGRAPQKEQWTARKLMDAATAALPDPNLPIVEVEVPLVNIDDERERELRLIANAGAAELDVWKAKLHEVRKAGMLYVVSWMAPAIRAREAEVRSATDTGDAS